MVRNVHLLWYGKAGRWFTVRELLLAQSFPVTSEMLDISVEGSPSIRPLCSFNVGALNKSIPPICRSSVANGAGNSMCTNIIGSVLCFLFAFLQRAPADMPPLAMLPEGNAEVDGLDGDIGGALAVWQQSRRKAGQLLNRNHRVQRWACLRSCQSSADAGPEL